MHTESRAPGVWTYERGPKPGRDESSAESLHLGLLLAFTFSLLAWAMIGVGIWLYVI
jgi:hypothetical protein